MKLIDTISISGAVGFFLIGIHQMMKYGFAHAYWAFMLMIGLFFYRLWRRGKEVEQEQKQAQYQKQAARKEKLKQNNPKKKKRKKRK